MTHLDARKSFWLAYIGRELPIPRWKCPGKWNKIKSGEMKIQNYDKFYWYIFDKN